jgi:hypothetical protein
MRVYVPVTRSVLRSFVQAGGLGPPPIVGFAVTGDLREWYAEGDQDELEYVAMTMAAQACLRLLAVSDLDIEPARRTVVAIDVDGVKADPADGRASVLVGDAVSAQEVAAVLADSDDAMTDVSVAVAVLRSGGPRDEDERFVVDACEAHELAWYATQEIGDLL